MVSMQICDYSSYCLSLLERGIGTYFMEDKANMFSVETINNTSFYKACKMPIVVYLQTVWP